MVHECIKTGKKKKHTFKIHYTGKKCSPNLA